MQLTNHSKKKIDIKKESVADLQSKIAESTTVVFTDFQGMTMPQLSDLRNKLFALEAEFTVTKNTLTVRALQSQNPPVETDKLAGPTATLFAKNDPVEAVKLLYTFAKTNQLPVVKFGIFDGSLLGSNELERISKLPGKQELLGQVVGTIGAPLYGLVGTLNSMFSSLVMTVAAIEAQRAGQASDTR